jgi:hypothetical protein
MAVITLNQPLTTASGHCPIFPDGAQAFTPTNDVDTFSAAVMVYVGATGNVVIRPGNGNVAVTFANVPAGTVLPCRALGVNLTSTTATSLVAIY